MFKYMRAQAYNNKGGVEFAKKQKRILIIALIILIFGIVATLITIPLVKNNNEKRTLKDKLENLEIPYTGESDISLPIMLDKYVITCESSHQILYQN